MVVFEEERPGKRLVIRVCLLKAELLLGHAPVYFTG